jgi:L-glyceraldehyde 3-phosphate reductase
MVPRPIPNTDLLVSPVCLGTMLFGTPVGEAEAIRLVHWALDHGVNFIDTANMYEGYTRTIGSPGGVAEEILGKALAGRRERAVIATKVANAIGPNPDDQGLSRKHIFREIDRSLARLQTDYVDFYLMHRPDPETPLAESIQAFADLIAAGKVRYWGVSNFGADQIQQILDLCAQNGWPQPVINQPYYNILSRDVERDALRLCAERGIAVTPYRPLEGGLLSGKYASGQAPDGSRAQEKPEWVPKAKDDAVLAKVAALQALADEVGKPLSQYAISWLLARPAVASVVVGVKRIEQLADNIAGAQWEFPREHEARVDAITA